MPRKGIGRCPQCREGVCRAYLDERGRLMATCAKCGHTFQSRARHVAARLAWAKDRAESSGTEIIPSQCYKVKP